MSAPLEVVVDDFDQYESEEELAREWRTPGHGGVLRQHLDREVKAGGRQSLRCEYATKGPANRFYCAISREGRWDLSGCDSLRFWLRPDGSGRELTVQLNVAGEGGRDVHDLWERSVRLARGDAAPRLVVVPFTELRHNTQYADGEVSAVFRPEAVIEIALYIGGTGDEPGEGVYHFDAMAGIGP